MRPFFFGARDRPLFGIHLPARGPAQRRGVVICPPWGREYLLAHRSLRLLAERLADAGLDVLRFDYYGTGDSGGTGGEVTLQGCADDVRTAADELRDLASVRRVTLVGLRLGAAIAAAAAAGQRTVDRVVLWEPVPEGARLLERLSADPEAEHADGFPLPRRLREELQELRPESFSTAAASTLLLTSERRAEHDRLRARLEGGGAAVEHVVLPAPPVWTEDAELGRGAVPVHLFQRMATWPG